jgi:hypothetical protein
MIKRPHRSLGFFPKTGGKKSVGNAARKLSYLSKGKIRPIHVERNAMWVNPPTPIEKINYSSHNAKLSFLRCHLQLAMLSPNYFR